MFHLLNITFIKAYVHIVYKYCDYVKANPTHNKPYLV